MIFGIVLEANEEEEKMISRRIRDLTAQYTDEQLEIRMVRKSSKLMVELDGVSLLDMAIIDVTLPGGLEGAKRVRKKFSNTEILVVADVSVSPMEYMHPSIRASALLLRPMSQEWRTVIRDFFKASVKKGEEEDGSNVLWIENRDGTFRVPFDHIFYLEAREKKVFIRTRMEEYAVNEALERLEQRLPDNFSRCHRSFIVNKEYVTKIRLSDNTIYLKEGLFVPVSRSYKEAFKRRSNV